MTLTLPSTLTLTQTQTVTHKACAKYFILISVVGHVTAHYVNYAKVGTTNLLTHSLTNVLTALPQRRQGSRPAHYLTHVCACSLTY